MAGRNGSFGKGATGAQNRWMAVSLAKRMEIIAALKARPNVSHVFDSVGKRIGVSYGSVWNIAAAEGIKLVRFTRQWAKPFLAEKHASGSSLRLRGRPKMN